MAQDAETKFGLTSDEPEKDESLRAILKEAKDVLGGIGMKDSIAAKRESAGQLKKLADKFVGKASHGERKELKELKQELGDFADEVEAKFGLKEDEPSLPTLMKEAKTVISGIKEDDESKLKAANELRSIADQFVNTLKKDSPEEAKKKLQPLREELASMAQDAETKFGLTSDEPEKDESLRAILKEAKDVLGGIGMKDSIAAKRESAGQLKKLADKFVGKASHGERKELKELKQELGDFADEVEAKFGLKEDEPSLPTLMKEAKTVISGIKEDDESKLMAANELRSIADQFVNTLKKDSPEEAKKKLQPLREELGNMASDAEAKFGLNEEEKKLEDMPYLHMLVGTAKKVVGEMKADAESKTKAVTEIKSLADKFIGTLRDLKANKVDKKTVAELDALREELGGIQRDMGAKLKL